MAFLKNLSVTQFFPMRAKARPEQFHNIIVRMPNWIGDVVMATPVLEDLRKNFPNSSITAMCQRPVCELFEADEDIDELYCFSKLSHSLFERRKQRKALIEKLKEGNYDLGILLTNSFSSAWRFWQGGVQTILGYKNDLRSFLLDIACNFPEKKDQQHLVITYKALLKPLGIEISQTKPRLFIKTEEMDKTKQLLIQRGYLEGQKLIGINPGAAYGPAKRWPKDRFRSVIEKLLVDENIFVVCFGDDSSVDLVKEICQGLSKRVSNLAGVTSLRELVCIIKHCNVLLTNDSGPMHIAVATKTPVVALFGSTDDTLTGPYEHGTVIRKQVECSPCFLKTCPIDFRCMKKIEVEEVYQAILKELKKHV